MPTDYRAVSAYNEEQLGKDRASRMSQVSMYADTAHFVYEILQNADDAGATEIIFEVSDERLVIEHNGSAFSSDDVKAISYFGKGKTDITKIGHFGLGFKSVFAYTASPRVHSGDENFEITNLYSLRGVSPPPDLERGKTRFVLPFDHAATQPDYIEAGRLKKGATARKEITAKLSKLGPETLLFTRNLASIQWRADGAHGQYLRQEYRHATGCRELFISMADGEESCFLVFEQPVRDSGGVGPSTTRLVQIAAKLSKRLSAGGQISPVSAARLFVFFQTDKETHIGLIVQAPYRTTPARDNIPQDDEFNRLLVLQTADLLVDTVQQMKKMKLLSLETLSCFPLDFEQFPEGSFLYPLYKGMRNALARVPLLPTSTGGFVAAHHAKLSRSGELTKVFEPDQLETLFGIEGVRWLSPALTAIRFPALHQILVGKRRSQPGLFQKAEWASEPLATDIEVTPESLVPRLTAEFLRAQSDEWLKRLMRYVAKGNVFAFHEIPIVRLESGKQVVPIAKDGQPNAYVPSRGGLAPVLKGLPMVKASMLDEEDIVEFLQDDLEIGSPDYADYALRRVLPRYQRDDVSVESSQWKNHFQAVVLGLATDSIEKRNRLTEALRATKFLIGVASSDATDLALVMPSELYFQSPEVEEYFAGSEDIFFTTPSAYGPTDYATLEYLGVASQPRSLRRPKDERGNVSITHWHGWHRRGLRGFDPDWRVEGLESALANPTVVRSRVIWKVLLKDSTCIRGEIESSSRQSFENASRKESISDAGRLLIESAWLPRQDNTFARPNQIGLEELPNGFDKTSDQAQALADKLGMKKSAEQIALSILTRGDERKRRVAEYLMNASEDDWEKVEKLIPKQRDIPEFKSFREGVRDLHRLASEGSVEPRGSSEPVMNPGRYVKIAADSVQKAKDAHGTSSRIISFSVARESSSNKLAREFLEQEYQGRCQIAGYTFRKRSGGNYFVVVSLVSRLNAEYLNDAGNMLCLSADMAAQFMHADFAWIDSVEEKIRGFKATNEGGDEVMRQIRVRIAGRNLTVTWSERHFLRLVALWNAA